MMTCDALISAVQGIPSANPSSSALSLVMTAPRVRLPGSSSLTSQFTAPGVRLLMVPLSRLRALIFTVGSGDSSTKLALISAMAVLPGATPAPCQVRLSQFMGGPTRLIPFAPILFYQQDRQQPVNGANGMTGETTPSGEPAAVPNAVAVNSVNGNGNSAAANNANSTNAADLDAEGAAAAQAANETAAMAEEAAGVAEEAAANGDVNTAVNASNASTRASQVANDAAGTANSIAASTKSAAANNAAASANNAAKRAINAASNAFKAAQNAVNIANANAAANAP